MRRSTDGTSRTAVAFATQLAGGIVVEEIAARFPFRQLRCALPKSFPIEYARSGPIGQQRIIDDGDERRRNLGVFATTEIRAFAIDGAARNHRRQRAEQAQLASGSKTTGSSAVAASGAPSCLRARRAASAQRTWGIETGEKAVCRPVRSIALLPLSSSQSASTLNEQ